ncbi:MAG: putative ABC transporter permease subunit [Massilia sp.]
MRLLPGSALWLLRHELRLFWFRLGGSGGKGPARRGPRVSAILIAAVGAIVLHVFAWKLLSTTDGGAGMPPAAVLMTVTAVFVLIFSLMLSHAIKASIEVLFVRDDLDLLLSSPLPSRSIFVVRLGAIVIGTAAMYLFLLTPFAHVGALLGQPRWMAIYPVVLAAAAIAASGGMLLSLGLVRLMGVRRTRVVAQVLGALIGAVFFLLSQLYGNAGAGLQSRVARLIKLHAAAGGLLGSDSALWLPARATLGAPWPLLAVALFGLAAFWLTAQTTHGFFVRGLQQVVSQPRGATRRLVTPRQRFGMSLSATVIAKEWRLIARDPQLISQVLLQLLYLLPLCFVLVFKTDAVLPGLGASLVFLGMSLTTSLAWLIIAAEEAPDLLRASPASLIKVARAKLAAAVTPALFLLAAPLAWVAWRAPAAALLLAACVAGGAISAGLIVHWSAVPAARGDFQRRARGNVLSTFLEFGTGMVWSGLSWTALSWLHAAPHTPPPALSATLLCLALLALMALAWARREKTA